MLEIELLENFRIIKNWNGVDDLDQSLKKFEYGFGKKCIEELEKNVLLRQHPLLVMLAKKGFRHVDVIRHGFNDTVASFENNIMAPLLGCLKGLNLEASEMDIELLQKNIESENEVYTYGDAIATLIATHGQAIKKKFVFYYQNPSKANFKQLFVLLFFINTPWYREMRFRLTHGMIADRYRFFAYFFKDCINLDLIGPGYYEDFDKRVDLLYQKFGEFTTDDNNFCRQITLMDGHGRFLRLLIEKILLNLNSMNLSYATFDAISFKVYDEDVANNLWHEYIFPETNEKMAINDEILNFETKSETIDNNGIIYLNFSNISKDRLKTLVDYLRSFKEEENRRVVISFFVSHVVAEVLDEFVQFLEREMKFVALKGRNDLLTFYHE